MTDKPTFHEPVAPDPTRNRIESPEEKSRQLVDHWALKAQSAKAGFAKQLQTMVDRHQTGRPQTEKDKAILAERHEDYSNAEALKRAIQLGIKKSGEEKSR